MIFQILGSGCPNCLALEANVKEALEERGLDHSVEKITDIDKIVDMGVLTTPALVIDGKIKSTGKVLTREMVFQLLDNED